MSNHSTILHKRSTTSLSVPPSNALSAGEIAINVADAKLFIKDTDEKIKTFLNAEQQPYTLDQSLSSVNFQYGENNVSEILSMVLGGINNDVSGAGSTVVNGSDNDIVADYAFIGNGSNNKINSSADYSAILGGQNNTLNHEESFILGSNITSHLSGFTYVENLSAIGKYYGDGSGLTGITAGTNSGGEYLPLSGGTLTGNLTSLSSAYFDGELYAGNYPTTTLIVQNSFIGINTEIPNKELTVVGEISSTGIVYTDDDVEITNSSKGIILTSPNNSKWRITVNDSGVLSVVLL
jgi:hypothetical protein